MRDHCITFSKVLSGSTVSALGTRYTLGCGTTVHPGALCRNSSASGGNSQRYGNASSGISVLSSPMGRALTVKADIPPDPVDPADPV